MLSFCQCWKKDCKGEVQGGIELLMIEGNIRNPPQQEIILISCRGNQQCTYDISHINSIKVRLEHSTDCAHHKRQANFNSIKVRLELAGIGGNLLPASKFQFHKGTIRTNNLLKSKKLHVNFNSIKVRLEHPDPDPENQAMIFQFHKGTIRTEKT